MHGPRVHIVWIGTGSREMSVIVIARVVPIPRCNHELVPLVTSAEQIDNLHGNLVASSDTERPTLGEVVLHVNNQQRTSHRGSLLHHTPDTSHPHYASGHAHSQGRDET